MNIRELAEKAGGHSNMSEFRGHFLPPTPDYIDPSTVNLQQFANLVLEEAAEKCEELADDAGREGDYYDCARSIRRMKQ